VADKGAIALSESLKLNSSLQELDLFGNLTQILNENVLIFIENQIRDKGAIALSECLKSNSSLRKLKLRSESNQKYD
jgi:hypothetical protein